MTDVDATFWTRWASGDHVGAAKPEMRVYLRRGRFRRGYQSWPPADAPYADPMENIYIPGEDPSRPWAATWQGTVGQGTVHSNVGEWEFEDWIEVPNVLSFGREQGFNENGINRGTLTIENVVMAERAAVSPMEGVFHTIEHGYLSPWKGYTPPGRPKEHDKTPWHGLLFRNAEVRVDQGYGDAMVTTFKGAIDDVDMESSPDRIVVSCRDFGQQLVDSRMFGWNTSKQLVDPTVFADRYKAEDVKRVGGGASASSESNGRLASAVADGEVNSAWYSAGHTTPGNTEWVQVRLPAGRYTEFELHTLADNMEVYVGVYARNKSDGSPSKINGQDVDEGFIAVGNGTVDGVHGGWPFIKKIGATTLGPRKYRFGFNLDLGPDSVLRVAFRNLKRHETGKYHASVRELQALKRTRKTEAKRRKWILTDDVSDVVKVVLRWAGFKEWRIERAGVRLKDNLVVNRADFYMDVIRKCCEQTGFEFFMGDPTGPDSLGVPTFRQNSSLRETNAIGDDGRPKPTRTIRDKDLLTGISVKLTDEPLAYIIRARGRRADEEHGGLPIGGTPTRRKMFVWWPPWTLENRMGGFIKHVIHYDQYLRTTEECEIAAYLIGLQQALKSATAIAQIPGNPGFELDDQLYLVDAGTGLSTRLWVAQRSDTFTTGERGSWTMTLGGSLIDTPDIVAVKKLIHQARARGLQVPTVIASGPQQTVVVD